MTALRLFAEDNAARITHPRAGGIAIMASGDADERAGTGGAEGLQLPGFSEHLMRAIIAVATLLSGPALADSVRHLDVPERLVGTWAPSTELCRDDKSTIVVSSRGYASTQESCEVQWVTETAGRDGPIYSARLRCAKPGAPEQKEEQNRLIVPRADGQFSAGSGFDDLKSYQRCPTN
jgi:hypothetical protein